MGIVHSIDDLTHALRCVCQQDYIIGIGLPQTACLLDRYCNIAHEAFPAILMVVSCFLVAFYMCIAGAISEGHSGDA